MSKLVCDECDAFLDLDRPEDVTVGQIMAFIDAHAGHARLAVNLEFAVLS